MDRFVKPKTKIELIGDDFCSIVKAKFVARNTLAIDWENGNKTIRLHNTDVVTFKPSGEIVLDSGGWNTPTTRDRINLYLPATWYIQTIKGDMFVTTPAGTFSHVDGATFWKNGKPRKPTLHKNKEKQKKIDTKLIDQYCVNLILAFENDPSGDPWVAPDSKTGKYAEQYVRGWLEEKYHFQSLIVAALRYGGFSDMSVSLALHDIQKRGKFENYHKQKIRRFIRACLGS